MIIISLGIIITDIDSIDPKIAESNLVDDDALTITDSREMIPKQDNTGKLLKLGDAAKMENR